MSGVSRGTVVVLTALAVVCGGVGIVGVAAQGPPTVSVADATLSTDETTQVAVRLSGSPDGVAGYTLHVATADTAVATITSVSAPDDGAFVTETTAANGSRGTVEWVDVNRTVEAGDTDVRLATVTVRSVTAGQTAVSVSVERLDDDSGDAMRPATDGGLVTVDTTSDGGGGGGGSGGADAADTVTAVTPTETTAPTPTATPMAVTETASTHGTRQTPDASDRPTEAGPGADSLSTGTATVGSTTTATTTEFPGFGPVVAVVALALVLLGGVGVGSRRAE